MTDRQSVRAEARRTAGASRSTASPQTRDLDFFGLDGGPGLTEDWDPFEEEEAIAAADPDEAYALRRVEWSRKPSAGVPKDLGSSMPKASGRIELPLDIRWSGPPLTYDLDDRADRARVYEQVLREGTESDVRYYVEAHQLVELWDELVLPPAVRDAWAGRIAFLHGG